MKTISAKLLFVLLMLCLVYGCNIEGRKTKVEVVDIDRHYYPVLRGQMLDVVYTLHNTGENPLMINDIKTSCGCVIVDESSFKVLPSGGKGFIRLKYDSSKNLGYVKHFIDIYANVETQKLELTFDLHVVPNALYTRDYEELYTEYKQKNSGIDEAVEGKENNMGYYTKDTEW